MGGKYCIGCILKPEALEYFKQRSLELQEEVSQRLAQCTVHVVDYQPSRDRFLESRTRFIIEVGADQRLIAVAKLVDDVEVPLTVADQKDALSLGFLV